MIMTGVSCTSSLGISPPAAPSTDADGLEGGGDGADAVSGGGGECVDNGNMGAVDVGADVGTAGVTPDASGNGWPIGLSCREDDDEGTADAGEESALRSKRRSRVSSFTVAPSMLPGSVPPGDRRPCLACSPTTAASLPDADAEGGRIVTCSLMDASRAISFERTALARRRDRVRLGRAPSSTSLKVSKGNGGDVPGEDEEEEERGEAAEADAEGGDADAADASPGYAPRVTKPDVSWSECIEGSERREGGDEDDDMDVAPAGANDADKGEPAGAGALKSKGSLMRSNVSCT